MDKNVGSVDRVLRAVVGLALIAIALVGPKTPWGWIGLVPLITAGMSWCPLYTVLGIKTCTTEPSSAK